MRSEQHLRQFREKAEALDSATGASMSSSMQARLKKRKLDALRRGIHRVGQDENLPFCVSVVGIGKAGADIVAEVLRTLPSTGPKMAALVVDIGEDDLKQVREAAATLPAGRADVEIISLERPPSDQLDSILGRYREFLALEYPMFRWKLEGGGSWLPRPGSDPVPGAGVRRAYAKALYGCAYYAGERKLKAALSRFGARVEAGRAQSMVCMAFGLSGGTGSGVVVDMARHLSNVVMGRQALVVGLGVLPCDGDGSETHGSALFATLNELDCLGDEAKNQGVVTACGELFRNPFTAGFLAVPQQPIWESTRDLAKTHSRVTAEIAALLTARGGSNLWETLRLLNWVAAPSTQHSAARTPWGPKWIHMLGIADAAGHPVAIGPDLPQQLGLLASYRPEFIEARMTRSDGAQAAALAGDLAAAFAPDVAPQVTAGAPVGSVQFILPSIGKTDLGLFFEARDAYDALSEEERMLDHAMLLDQGVVLSEPSTRIAGMAGASLSGSDSWVAVPLDDLRGGERPVPAPAQHRRRAGASVADARVA